MKAIQVFIMENQYPVILGIEQQQQFSFTIEDDEFTLLPEDVEIIPVDIPGWKVANEGNITVALDIIITDELREEGTARELINRIQNIRKEKKFEVTDKIFVLLSETEYLKSVVNKFSLYIRTEILAAEIRFSSDRFEGESVEIEAITINIQVSKA